MPFFGSSNKGKYDCRIVMLDNTEKRQQITNKTYGHELLWKILSSLDLYEKEYFGIRYKDKSGYSHWLVLHKTIKKQIINYDPPYVFYFGVKFYAADPTKLQEEVTRYQFFLQVKRDILHGRIVCDQKTTAELSAYAVQSELGDYDPAVHTEHFLSEFRFVPNQTVELENMIQEKYENLRGMLPAKAELKFLERVKWLDMYGVDLHPVRGQDNMEYLLGLTPTGIVLYKKKNKIGSFIWLKVTKLKYKGSCFLLRATQGRNDEEKEYAFICSTKDNAKSLWKLCAEQHTFFRLEKANNMPASGFNVLFRKGNGNKLGGRSQQEIDHDDQLMQRGNQPIPKRTPSQRFSRRDGDKDLASDIVHIGGADVSSTSTGSNLYEGLHSESDHPPTNQNRSYENNPVNTDRRTSPKAGMNRTGYSSAGEAEQKKRRGHYYSGYTNTQSDQEGGRSKTRYGSAPNMHNVNTPARDESNRQSRQYSQESLYPNAHQQHLPNGCDPRGNRPCGTKSDSEETSRRRRHHHPHRHSGVPNGNQTDTEMVPALDIYRNTMGVAVNGNEEHRQKRHHHHHNGQRHHQRSHRHSQYAYDPSQAEVLLELGPPTSNGDVTASKPDHSRTPSHSDNNEHRGYHPPPQYMHQQPGLPYGIPHGITSGPTPPQFIPQYYPPHLINQVRHQMMQMHNVSQHLYRPQYVDPQHMTPPRSSTSQQKSPAQSGRSTTSSSKSPTQSKRGDMANYSVSTEL